MSRIELARALMMMRRVRVEVTRWPRGEWTYSLWVCD
jgi:hypothetical protein